MYFNPRPRKEGDIRAAQKNFHGACISIHALVKRATHSTFTSKVFKTISIHALVKRATSFVDYIVPNLYISIHALVKRATKFCQ